MNSLSKLFRSFRPSFRSSRSSYGRLCGHRLGMEPLEDRTLLSVDLGLDFALSDTGTSFFTEHAADVATDASGNAYVTGYFHGTMDADPGPGVFNLASSGDREPVASGLR